MNNSSIRRLVRLLRQYKIELKQVYVYAIFSGLVDLTLPLGIQAIINFIQIGELTSSWVILVVLVMMGIAINGFLQMYQLRIMENIQQNLFARSAFEFAYRIPKIIFMQLDKIHAPELVHRFFDTLTIQKGLPKILMDFSLSGFKIVFGLILLAIYSPYFMVLGLTLFLILWGLFKLTGKKGLDTSLRESKYKYQLVHWLTEVARVNRTLKINATESFHLDKTNTIVEKYLGHRESHFKVLLTQFKMFIGFKILLAAGLLILGGYLVFGEKMNLGQFVAAEIIIIMIINSVEKIIGLIDSVYDVLTALEKIGYVTDLQLDKEKGSVVPTTDKGFAIEAKNIQFQFPGESHPVIDDWSFKIEGNDRVLLKGSSGAGKTLLLQILAGVHTVQSGELTINERLYENYNFKKLQSFFGVNFAPNQIFEGSFKDNILLGRDIPPDCFREILEVLGLDVYFSKQSQEIETMIDSGGRRLPRSVIQKIMIARLVVHCPKLLLLEDPLQFIEDSEKKKIIDYLVAPERDWTMVIISDNIYWSNHCTRELDLDKL